jgi:hypothetical protein
MLLCKPFHSPGRRNHNTDKTDEVMNIAATKTGKRFFSPQLWLFAFPKLPGVLVEVLFRVSTR